MEATGKPININIQQRKGFVYMSFTDNSLCEEAFAIERVSTDDSNDVHVIAANYMFFSQNDCGDRIAPNKNYADDLERFDLQVGSKYDYCVTAIAKEYMANANTYSKYSNQYLKGSHKACVQHSILWVSCSRQMLV